MDFGTLLSINNTITRSGVLHASIILRYMFRQQALSRKYLLGWSFARMQGEDHSNAGFRSLEVHL